MSRMILTTAALILMMPTISLAEKKPAREPRKSVSDFVPASKYGEVKPCQSCQRGASIYPEWLTPTTSLHPGGHGAFGDELRSQLLWDQHECAPDGCIKPIGCGNFWTELKFVFGSCRQFFGTAESTVGHHRNTQDRFATPLR
jgi:hypothetical protein